MPTLTCMSTFRVCRTCLLPFRKHEIKDERGRGHEEAARFEMSSQNYGFLSVT